MHGDLAHELSRAMRGDVRFDAWSRVLYSTDASAYQIEPIGVAFPRDTDDLQAALEVAARHRVPVLARGNGTSLAGQAVGNALILDLSRHFDRVLEINPEERWVRVQPGVVCDALDAALRPHGLMFGPDPASSNRATLGGMIMNNATGAHSVLYGMTVDHLLAAEIFLDDASRHAFHELSDADLARGLHAQGREGDLLRGITALLARHGELIRARFPRTWRRASGYSLNYLLSPPYTALHPAGWPDGTPYPPPSRLNLARLFASSEGTLGVLAEARLHLVPRPKQTVLSVLHFPTVAQAAEATPRILESAPSAVEMIDALIIRLARSLPAYARQLGFIRGDPGAILIVEFAGDSSAELEARRDALERRLQAGGITTDVVRATTPAEQAQVWGVRKVGLGLLTSMRGEAKPASFMEDVAVPVERLGEYVRRVEGIFRDHGVDSAYYAHASAGCLHIRPVLNLKKPEGVAEMRAIGAEVLEVVLEMGGAMSGEHGDGLSRSTWNERLFGRELYQVLREVKRLFDPGNRMNPGKIVDAPDLTEHLRYTRPARALPTVSPLSFTAEGGFAAAVEQCSGIGECRKASGTMCPSFKATREEEHSTRGRANLLRAAMSGTLPASELTSRRMHDALDLCLECKACKAECPAAVDMAKIKYEWLARYQAEHGVPLRSRFFGGLPEFLERAARTPRLANWMMAAAPARWAANRLLGLAPERQLPALAATTFRAWFAGRTAPTGPAPAGDVILFVDTFTNVNHPEIGRAAVRVLEAAGCRVRLVGHGCCGRTKISKGLLAEARDAARRNLDVLAPHAASGTPIVGLEPSCLLTFRDEYLDLLPEDPRARQVAARTLMIEEYLTARAAAGDFAIRWKPDGRTVHVHGHCYQKALTGTRPVVEMLRLPGWSVREIDSGCCGMAGAFGYEREHYAISQAIGEERLFPAVRSAPASDLVVASGMSCRHQIGDGTARRALHPIEALAEVVAE